MTIMKHIRRTCLPSLAMIGFVLTLAAQTQAADFQDLSTFLGPRDAMVVSGPDGSILFSHHEDLPLVPASTLKILTALVAFQYLGEDYRFKTEFYLDDQSNLKIKGYGDPLLTSEVIAEVCTSLFDLLKDTAPALSSVIVDPSYYDNDVAIPGITDSTEPYDAPNGALCVNFNTVNFRKAYGRYISAEPQTPLLPVVLDRIKKAGLSKGRITLSHERDELVLYAGHLFKHFLEKAGFKVLERVRIGQIDSTDIRVLEHHSPFSLKQVVAKMMTYSNNFMANQILLQSGVSQTGPPGNLKKGVDAITSYAKNILHMQSVEISEGSGISRKNHLTALDLHRSVRAFKPYHKLLRQDGNEFYKTGTLKNISTRAGFVGTDPDSQVAYVILCNTPGRSARPLRDRLLDALQK